MGGRREGLEAAQTPARFRAGGWPGVCVCRGQEVVMVKRDDAHSDRASGDGNADRSPAGGPPGDGCSVVPPGAAAGARGYTKVLVGGVAVALLALLALPPLLAAIAGGAARGASGSAERTGVCGPGRATARAATGFELGTLTAALSGEKLLQNGTGEVYVSIDLTARPVAAGGGANRPPVDLALVIDRSGSMSGGKLDAARRAAQGIVRRLADGDRVALVQYDSTAEVLVPLGALDPGGRVRLEQAIGGIVERGGTNLHGGMVLGQRELLGRQRSNPASVAGRVNRVVLLSDGQANEGITDRTTLGRIAGAAADQGVRLTTVGIGLGFNEDLMELLAENGRGRYYYAQDAGSLDQVFAGELAALQATVASATELRLVPGCPGVEVLEVFGYETRRQGAATVVPMVDLSGGDSRRLVAKLRVPTGATGRADLLAVELAYTDTRTRRPGASALLLGAEVTADPMAAQVATNREVMAHVVQVEAATAMRGAAAAYERGDRQAARLLLEKKQTEMRALARKLALDEAKISQALHDLPRFAGEIDAHDPSSDIGKHSLKLRKLGAKGQMKAKW
jgi:Ca-activated chloride channel family protein